MQVPTIVLHGGAGDIPDSRVALKFKGLRKAAIAGYRKLISNDGDDQTVDAVVAAVAEMEDDPSFNAGYGSVLNEDGEVQMDACVMEGRNLNAGAVTAIVNVAHPIKVAEKVMQTKHCLLASVGANRFAIQHGFEEVPADSLISPYAKQALETAKKSNVTTTNEIGHESIGSGEGLRSTVGAVAIDAFGHISSATSTGGLSNQMKCRVGDTPIIGAGNYADDNAGGVSMTGIGESLFRYLAAKRVADHFEYNKSSISANETIKNVLDAMTDRVGGDGGGVAISRTGEIGIEWNSRRMAWAFIREGILHFGCNRGEHFTEDLTNLFIE